MNELIKVNYDGERQTTSARSLWEFLDKPYTKFTMWFDKYKEYGFVENQDYRELSVKTYTSNGAEHDAIDYEITVDMGKELAMIQKTEKGKQARQYFIELEKQWNSPEAVMSRALKMADAKITSLQCQVIEMKPKAEKFELFMDGKNNQNMNNVAKTLGWGRNKLFEKLREDGIFLKNNTPKQTYIDRGYFIVIQKPIEMGESVIDKPQTLVTPKGINWLADYLREKAS